MHYEPRVSILVINRNYGKYLKACLESALNQTEPAHEVIMVDDGSTDDSVEVARKYSDRVSVFERPALGIYATQEFGVQKVTGDWIITLDSDDMLLPHCVSMVRSRITSRLSRISYRLRMVSSTGQTVGEEPSRKFKVPEGYVGDYWRNGWEITAPPASGNAYPVRVMKAAFETQNLAYLNKGFFPSDRWFQTVASFEGECLFIPDVCGLYYLHSSSVESGSLEKPSKILSRIEGQVSQASYLVAKYTERGHKVTVSDILAYRYYYWWLKIPYWYSTRDSEYQNKERRSFLAIKLLGCAWKGAQTHPLVRLSRTIKAIIVLLLPYSRWSYGVIIRLNQIERVRLMKK
jgi:glycosyltransferase involved in cell wall biosynthesis